MMSVMLAWSSVAAADCPFAWQGQPTIPGVGTTAEAITTWDPDGIGPLPPVLVVGGSTEIATDQYSGSVAMWNGGGWTPLGGGMNDKVKALAVHNSGLYVGGLFTEADGNSVNRIARWDGSTWVSVGGGVDAPAEGPAVLALCTFENRLIAGGIFLTAGGGAGYRRVASWNGGAWQKLHTGFVGGGVGALTVYQNQIIAGGAFTDASGVAANRVARWDGANWHPLPDAAVNGMEDRVNALTVFGGELIAGGWFITAGGSSVNRLAKWNGTAWADVGGGVSGGTDLTVNALCVFDDRLIVGGKFSMAGTQPVANIATWDGANWQAFGSFNERVDALAVSNGDLVAGGFFTVADGGAAEHLARWLPACLPGDMNCDQDLSMDDVPLFIEALLNAPAISSCDVHIANMNGDIASDGLPRVDGSDIAPFVQAMLNP